MSKIGSGIITVMNTLSNRKPPTTPAPVGEYDCYLSPTGSDTVGDGSLLNPWWSFKNVPAHSVVGLLPGVYSTVDYGIGWIDAADLEWGSASSWGGNVSHGLFADPINLDTTVVINGGRDLSINGTNGRVIDDPVFLAKFPTLTDYSGTTIKAVEGKGTVLIDYIRTPDQRQFDMTVTANNTVFQDIDFGFNTTADVLNADGTVDVGLMGYGWVLDGYNGIINNSDFKIIGDYIYLYELTVDFTTTPITVTEVPYTFLDYPTEVNLLNSYHYMYY